MRHLAILALGASALAVAACVPPGQGPGYGHNNVAYNPAYDDDHRGPPPLRLGSDDARADARHWDGKGAPPPWMTAGNGNGAYHDGDRDHDGPPPWTMARSGNGMGDDHHDGPPPWAGNGQGPGGQGPNGQGYGQGYGNQTHGTPPGGPPDQHGYCGPVFFPGCVRR